MAKQPDDWHEMSEVERRDWHKWIQQERVKAQASYESHPEARQVHCPYCRELIPYRSVSYYEGFHIDGCN